MAFLTITFNQTTQNKYFQAPVGKMYEISNVHFYPTAAGNNTVGIFDRTLEGVFTGVVLEERKPFAVYNASILTGLSINFDIPIRTKYLTMGRIGGATFGLITVIVYRFIEPTVSELIWEYIGKKR